MLLPWPSIMQPSLQISNVNDTPRVALYAGKYNKNTFTVERHVVDVKAEDRWLLDILVAIIPSTYDIGVPWMQAGDQIEKGGKCYLY